MFNHHISARNISEMSDYIVWLAQCAAEDLNTVGGKATGLGVLTRAGLPVPPGFAVTTCAYRQSTAVFKERIASIVRSGTDANDHAGASARIGRLFDELLLDPCIADPIADAYARLCERCGTADVPVAVRSSATAEDSAEASFAGQQETYLWIRGIEKV